MTVIDLFPLVVYTHRRIAFEAVQRSMIPKNMKVKTILSIVCMVLLAGSVGANAWLGVELYSLQKTHREALRGQEDRDVALGALYEITVFMADKFDELDAIFIEYDNLLAEFDDLFREDCYSYNVESTNRMYESIADRYHIL